MSSKRPKLRIVGQEENDLFAQLPLDQLERVTKAVEQLAGKKPAWLSDDQGRLLAKLQVDHPTGGATEQLLNAVCDLVNQLVATQQALRDREAELSAAVPVVSRQEEQATFAQRIEAVLRSTVQLLKCDAAAVYLLDDATTVLKLRAAWGLPADRFAAPPRKLAGALADLEAMLGHAVVLENRLLAPYWKPPENFPAGVCLPIASASQILGTMWIFSKHERPFSDRDIELLEIVAGRLAVEFERQALLQQTAGAKRLQAQWSLLADYLSDRLPREKPITDTWDIAGSVTHAQPSGAFYDWIPRPDGTICVAACSAKGGLTGAISAEKIRGLLWAFAQQSNQPQQILKDVNQVLWQSSPGEFPASVFVGLLQTPTGKLQWSAAGDVELCIWDPSAGVVPLHVRCETPLGVEEHLAVGSQTVELRQAQTLVVATKCPAWNQPLPFSVTAYQLPEFLSQLPSKQVTTADQLLALLLKQDDQHASLVADALLIVKQK